jgi:hypothetical protein
MKLFPWPVLTDEPDGDYPNQAIETSNLNCTSDGIGLIIDWTPTTTCPYLNALLEKGDAKWLIELQCHRTLFIERHYHSFGHLKIPVSPEDVRGTLHFRAYITTTKQLAIEPTGVNEQLAINLILNGKMHDAMTICTSAASTAAPAVGFSSPSFGNIGKEFEFKSNIGQRKDLSFFKMVSIILHLWI